MGGQACIFYGAAEFSRDLDLLVLLDPGNLERLQIALNDLYAELAAVPPLDVSYLKRGHAVHFRCGRKDVAGLRVDVMSALRGLPTFDELWQRRTSIEVEGEVIDLLGLEDLVEAKKTQRDKDWPMIRRLVEQSYFTASGNDSSERVVFWLKELRSAELLVEAARIYPSAARMVAQFRPAVQAALAGDSSTVLDALETEEVEERRKDRDYWRPLKHELEELRRMKRQQGPA